MISHPSKSHQLTMTFYLSPHLDSRQYQGMSLVYKDQLQINHNNTNIKLTYEYQDYTVEISKEYRLNLYILYRYLSTSVINFCGEFLDMLETNIVKDRGELILIGDFNIHMDSMNHPDTIIFSDCLDSLNLTNLVDFPMHKALHTLELIICDRQSNIVSSVNKIHLLSDLNTITCKIEVP